MGASRRGVVCSKGWSVWAGRHAYAIGAVALLSAGSVRADEVGPPVDLVWEAPPGCPTKQDVLANVAGILSAGSAPSARLAVHGTLTRLAEASFRLELEIRAGDGIDVRTIHAVSCVSLAKAAAVVITTALADMSEATPTTPVLVDPMPPPLRARPQPRRPPVSSSVLPPDRLSFVTNVAGTLEFGTLPQPAPGILLAVAADYRWIRAGIKGAAHFPQQVTFATPSVATGRFRMHTASAYGCALFEWWRVRAGPCAGVGVSLVQVAGVGLPNSRAVSLTAPEVIGAGLASLGLAPHIHVFLGVDVVFAFHSQVVGLRAASGEIVLHEFAVPALRGALGLEMRIP